MSTNGRVLCDFRINIDIIRTESGTNLKKLLELQQKVLSSNEDVKQQYEKPIQVSNGAALDLPHYTEKWCVVPLQLRSLTRGLKILPQTCSQIWK